MSNIPIRYDNYGRMQYHPDLHPKHQEPWSYADQQYLIERYAIDGPEDVSLALGRTIHVVMTRAYTLRKQGKMAKRAPGTKLHKRMQKGKP